jgi:Protein of unknown function (DUF3501)
VSQGESFGHRRLTLGDVYDLREYEHLRDEMRGRVIAVKRVRRVQVGPLLTVVFENRETVRVQVHEMIRAERMLTDEQVQGELDAYNPLIPDPGELSTTVFVELTDETMLREWLPKLVGIERHLAVVLGSGDDARTVRGLPDAAHAETMTRSDVTATVHYVRFRFDPAAVERFAAGPAVLVVDHPAYAASAELSEATRLELLRDLQD